MLGILTTHPIQYQVPIWKSLAKRGNVPISVFFMSKQGLSDCLDPDFGRSFAWDIDLCGGYDHEFLDVKAGKRNDSFLSLRLEPGFQKLLLDRGVKVLWIQGWQVAAYWQAILAARNLGIETWLRGDSNLKSSRAGWLRFAKDLALDRLLKRVERFLYTGEANKQFYLAHGIPDERLAPAPHCVDNQRFEEQTRSFHDARGYLRAQWGISEDAFCFLFVGKFISKKRPLDLAEAARRVQDLMPNQRIHLLWVGAGALWDAARAHCHIRFDAKDFYEAQKHGDPSGVPASFAGFLNQSEIAKAYVAADCLVLPSETEETWGLVVNEAMACGLPAIVSDAVGCAPNLLQRWPELCFPVGDVAALARSMITCIASPPSSEQIASVISCYDISTTVGTVERLYDSFASKASTRGTPTALVV